MVKLDQFEYIDHVDTSYCETPYTKYQKYLGEQIAIVLTFITFACLLSIAVVVWGSSNSIAIDETLIENTVPNIVFIMADDLGLGSVDGTETDIDFAAPYLSAMASNGIIISNFYAQEVCTPTRASFLTGRYPINIGMQYGVVQGDTSWGLPLNETTIASVLQASNYQTHVVGKWHLGHFSPQYLPTARGFDTFTGYLTGQNYYFSKKYPQSAHFQDFMTSDYDCFYAYEGASKHNYSTILYRDVAIDIIESRDHSRPLFLYLAFQAVHDPFVDVKFYQSGVPAYLIDDDINERIETEVLVKKRQEYAKALNVLDSAVNDIVNKLDDEGILDNTYVIFTSDNGGCYLGGGKNAPYRGTKGSFFEGGVKVDAFIYSPTLITTSHYYYQKSYPHLMHVSDWFPTLLGLVDIDYSVSNDAFALDGVSHKDALLITSYKHHTEAPRATMLYNSYHNVDTMRFTSAAEAPFAIRNKQFKLMYTYFVDPYSSYYNTSEVLWNDDDLTLIDDCSQNYNSVLDMEYALYDIVTDPYETNNLINDTNNYVAMTAKDSLLELLYNLTAALDSADIGPSQHSNRAAKSYWAAAGDCVVPFITPNHTMAFTTATTTEEGHYPSYCGATDQLIVMQASD